MDRQGQEVTDAIRRVLAGDVDAYAIVHRRYDRPLRARIRARYPKAGSDFVDEVAVRSHEYALARLPEYDADKASLLTWLVTQAWSAGSAVMREWYGANEVQFDPDRHEPWTVTATGPADVYEEQRRSRVLRQEMENLSEDGRQAVALHDMAGLTFAETAKAADTTVWKVRDARERALARLKRRLLRRGVRPVEVDTTPVPVFYGWDRTATDDDWTAPVAARLPDGPKPLSGAAEAEPPKEEAEVT